MLIILFVSEGELSPYDSLVPKCLVLRETRSRELDKAFLLQIAFEDIEEFLFQWERGEKEPELLAAATSISRERRQGEGFLAVEEVKWNSGESNNFYVNSMLLEAILVCRAPLSHWKRVVATQRLRKIRRVRYLSCMSFRDHKRRSLWHCIRQRRWLGVIIFGTESMGSPEIWKRDLFGHFFYFLLSLLICVPFSEWVLPLFFFFILNFFLF